MKRVLIITVVLLAILIGSGVLVYFALLPGSSPLEKWIGSQLQLVANLYLNPKLSFTDLDYTYPGTVSVKNLKLTAADPANPGKTIDILGCQQATITLAETPAIGKPIVIQKIVLDHPLISAVLVSQNSKQLIGFSNLIGSDNLADKTPTTQSKLSDHFQMRLVQINGGTILYDPRIAGTQPMQLDQIDTTLQIEPAEAGWYKINTALDRKPLFDLSIVGQLNLDDFSVRETTIKLAADLNNGKINYLPPQVQAILNKYEIHGTLNTTISGSLPLLSPRFGQAQAELKLTDANVTLDNYRIPIQSVNLAAQIEKGRAILSSLAIDSLRGTANLSGSAVINPQLDSDIQLTIANMMIQDLLAAKEGEEGNSRFAGKINASMHLTGPLNVVVHHLAKSSSPLATEPLPNNWGGGQIELTDGRLVNLPVIRTLSGAIDKAEKIIEPVVKLAPTKDRVKLDFNFDNEQIDFNEITYVGQFLAARGKGSIGLNQQVDLILSGGPLDKMKAVLGKTIGDAISKITDKLYAYHVTGTIHDPNVSVIVGNGSNLGDFLFGGFKKIGDTIGNIAK